MNLQQMLRQWQEKNSTLISVYTPTRRERKQCFNYLVKNNFQWLSGALIRSRLTEIWEYGDTRYIQVAGTTYAGTPPDTDIDSWFHFYHFNEFKILSFPEFLRFCKDIIAAGETKKCT